MIKLNERTIYYISTTVLFLALSVIMALVSIKKDEIIFAPVKYFFRFSGLAFFLFLILAMPIAVVLEPVILAMIDVVKIWVGSSFG